MPAIIVVAGMTAIVLVFGLFAVEILRQNGRLMRRLESVEGTLEQLASSDVGTRAGGFGDRSLAGSRINRDGRCREPRRPRSGCRESAAAHCRCRITPDAG